MADVSPSSDSVRTAVAAGRVLLGEAAYERVRDNDIEKGDVLTTAQIAGIMGAKQTSKLLPLCHDVQVEGVDVEALTAVSIAALTIYDMCKSVTKGIRIDDVHLLAKTGGQSGNWKSEDLTAQPSTN
mgnify:CR=1 FL=1